MQLYQWQYSAYALQIHSKHYKIASFTSSCLLKSLPSVRMILNICTYLLWALTLCNTLTNYQPNIWPFNHWNCIYMKNIKIHRSEVLQQHNQRKSFISDQTPMLAIIVFYLSPFIAGLSAVREGFFCTRTTSCCIICIKICDCLLFWWNMQRWYKHFIFSIWEIANN